MKASNSYFDEESATAEELWSHYMEKYNNNGVVAKYLVDNFYKTIGSIVVKTPKNWKILEVGCGPGESARRISQLLDGQDFEASEFEPRLVDMLIKQNLAYKVRQESVYQLERESKSINCLIMLEVLEHLDDYEKALDEIFRVAKNKVIISVPNEPLWRILNFLRGKYIKDFGNTPGHINHWGKPQLVKLLKKYGSCLKVYKSLPWLIAEIDV